MELSRVVDSCEILKSATPYSFTEFPSEVAVIKLEFESFCCYICLDEDSDEIMLNSESCIDSLVATDNFLIFNECTGSQLSWAWSMINNQGYSDSLKFAFKNGRVFELVVIASSIKQFRVSEL